MSQVNKLERQNTNLAINVFGWEKDGVIVVTLSEKGGDTARIKLMIIQKGMRKHYSYVKRLAALLYDQKKHNESKHIFEPCLHGYQRKDLLIGHKPKCKGLLKRPTRT